MITYSFEKYCEHCAEIDPEAVIFYGFNRPEEITIKCEHEARCRRIYKQIKEEQDHDQDHDSEVHS